MEDQNTKDILKIKKVIHAMHSKQILLEKEIENLKNILSHMEYLQTSMTRENEEFKFFFLKNNKE